MERHYRENGGWRMEDGGWRHRHMCGLARVEGTPKTRRVDGFPEQHVYGSGDAGIKKWPPQPPPPHRIMYTYPLRIRPPPHTTHTQNKSPLNCSFHVSTFFFLGYFIFHHYSSFLLLAQFAICSVETFFK
ncbi:hypothetical protein VNO78_18571 [Psophocarpus tetragonolobus]|uniref:Uncharacterized protein n=1 Tax=Psophocarpus tetragonolobus TaxID=3891 RepID=A0AAN9SJK6_PSOTE